MFARAQKSVLAAVISGAEITVGRSDFVDCTVQIWLIIVKLREYESGSAKRDCVKLA